MIINITRKEPDQIGWRAFMIQTPIIIANTGLFELQITVPFEANWTVPFRFGKQVNKQKVHIKDCWKKYISSQQILKLESQYIDTDTQVTFKFDWKIWSSSCKGSKPLRGG